jgi:hypothetical protein
LEELRKSGVSEQKEAQGLGKEVKLAWFRHQVLWKLRDKSAELSKTLLS